MAEPIPVRALGFSGKLLLRGGAEVRDKAGAVLGFPLPADAMRATVGAGAEALWLGPDEWLLLVPADTVEAVTGTLSAELGGLHHALVPLSHRFVGIAIHGPHAADLLAAGCPLDLHPRAFGPGTVTRTLLGKAEIILHRPEAGSGFRLYVPRSFAPYLWAWLAAAAREFGGLAEAAA
jgi:sarcosine oxidase subunit gamma